MAAFEKGIGAGAAGVELDIWRCGSGELVVVHDESVPGLGSISHLSLESIRRFNGQIPTLKEVLVGLPSSVINIEIKSSKRDSRLSNGHPVLDSLVALLGETSNRHRLVFSTFDRQIASQLPRLSAFGSAALLTRIGTNTKSAIDFAVANGIGALHLPKDKVSPRSLKAIEKAGLSFSVWTVDDPREIEEMLRAGAALLITNNVGAAVALAETEIWLDVPGVAPVNGGIPSRTCLTRH